MKSTDVGKFGGTAFCRRAGGGSLGEEDNPLQSVLELFEHDTTTTFYPLAHVILLNVMHQG